MGPFLRGVTITLLLGQHTVFFNMKSGLLSTLFLPQSVLKAQGRDTRVIGQVQGGSNHPRLPCWSPRNPHLSPVAMLLTAEWGRAA